MESDVSMLRVRTGLYDPNHLNHSNIACLLTTVIIIFMIVKASISGSFMVAFANLPASAAS